MWLVIERLVSVIIVGFIILVFVMIVAQSTACERIVTRKATILHVSLVVDSPEAGQQEVLKFRGIPDRGYA
ncbi:MAG: hypothetical protein GY847_05110 [Proteobacteria bacterium]|nr:hypothetical protein [Pseudomonadota bacterium]